ncbi:MAG: cation transporter [Eubacterium sp.]|nr:cation transporter [Eubacterium sp.]
MSENLTEQSRVEQRNKVIMRTSMIGIGANVLLAVVKAVIGLAANSIAVTLDAVNNLSDAMSSVITIIGTKLAGRQPDKKHPLGYGRIEYLSAMIVSALVLYAGITAAVESVKKILDPQTPSYTNLALILIAIAVVVKIVLGTYVKKKGEQVNSGSLIASGSDAKFDAILSASVLATAILFRATGISLEAYVGVVIAVFIIKAGIEMLKETLDDILGSRVDREIVEQLKETICEEPEVLGAYDLLLHNYGPDYFVGSVHVEIPDTMTVDQVDALERRLAGIVFQKHGVILSAVGIYAVHTRNDERKRMQTEITRIVMSHEGVLQMHGFYVDENRKQIRLDVVIDFAVENREAVVEEIRQEIIAAYPGYDAGIILDLDF